VELPRIYKRFPVSNFARMIRCDAMVLRLGGLAAIERSVPGSGKLIVVGVPADPIPLSATPLIFSGLSVYGSLTGTPMDSEDTLALSVLENIRPMIETVPLEKAADGFTRTIEGKARFRMVLVTRYGMAQAALRHAENHNPLREGKRRRPR
jgi:hypothetical protein